MATGPRGSPITSATWRQSSRRYLGSHAVAATTPRESAHSANPSPIPARDAATPAPSSTETATAAPITFL